MHSISSGDIPLLSRTTFAASTAMSEVALPSSRNLLVFIPVLVVIHSSDVSR